MTSKTMPSHQAKQSNKGNNSRISCDTTNNTIAIMKLKKELKKMYKKFESQ
jgi:hypothetical protein